MSDQSADPSATTPGLDAGYTKEALVRQHHASERMCSLSRASGALGYLLVQLHSAPSGMVTLPEQDRQISDLINEIRIWVECVAPSLEGPDDAPIIAPGGDEHMSAAAQHERLAGLAIQVAYLQSQIESRLLNEWIAPSQTSLSPSAPGFGYDQVGAEALEQRLTHHRALREEAAHLGTIRQEMEIQLSSWKPATSATYTLYQATRRRIAGLIADDPLLPAELDAVAPVLGKSASAWNLALAAASLEGWAQTTMDLIDLHLEQIAPPRRFTAQ